MLLSIVSSVNFFLRVVLGLCIGLLLGAVIFTATPARAQSCGYAQCWGAVAIGPGSAYGFSHGYGSERDAINVAQQGCQYDCNVVRTFYNTCAAIAVADNGGWGWGWHAQRELAESTAMNYCMDQGRNCRVRVWSCSK